MSCNSANTPKLDSLRPVYCPLTSKLIIGEVNQIFDIPNGRVTWFHCEACGGWHLVIDNHPPKEPSPPANPSHSLNPANYFGDS